MFFTISKMLSCDLHCYEKVWTCKNFGGFIFSDSKFLKKVSLVFVLSVYDLVSLGSNILWPIGFFSFCKVTEVKLGHLRSKSAWVTI